MMLKDEATSALVPGCLVSPKPLSGFAYGSPPRFFIFSHKLVDLLDLVWAFEYSPASNERNLSPRRTLNLRRVDCPIGHVEIYQISVRFTTFIAPLALTSTTPHSEGRSEPMLHGRQALILDRIMNVVHSPAELSPPFKSPNTISNTFQLDYVVVNYSTLAAFEDVPPSTTNTRSIPSSRIRACHPALAFPPSCLVPDSHTFAAIATRNPTTSSRVLMRPCSPSKAHVQQPPQSPC